jgi:hypothetical protein
MPLVPCPDCFRRKSTFDDRGNGECKPCRGTGDNLDPISGLVTASLSTAAGTRDKCWRCGGNGQCKTCGGLGEIRQEEPGEQTGPQRSERGATERKSQAASKEARSKVRDDESSGAYSALAGMGAPIGGFAGGGGGGGAGGGGGKAALVVFLIILFIPFYVYHQWRVKRDAIAALGTEHIRIAVQSNDGLQDGILKYSHGQPQTLTFYITWEGPVYFSKRPMRLMLLREGHVQYDQTWEHDDLFINRFAVEIPGHNFPIGRYVARAIVQGAPAGEYTFVVRPTPPGYVVVSETLFNEWPQGRVATLCSIGQVNVRKFIWVPISTETIPPQGRHVYIGLIYQGSSVFNYSYLVTEQNRHFYIPYEADFSEGVYTARLSADGEPPAVYAFKVQYPIVESAFRSGRLLESPVTCSRVSRGWE